MTTTAASLDPITAELIASSLIYASEEMGIAVRDAAYSPNIKERLDHSCALFDARARLVAQAEHIPVHLGSLPWGLRRTLAWLGERGRTLERGEMIVVNDPYLSGTHLNDVTVIRAIYHDGRLVGYAANKAHQTDVGGAVPGSMPPDARDLFAEGAVITPCALMRDDRVVDETVDLLMANSRTPEARAGDLRAQVAGNVVGERRFLELIERYGAAVVEAALDRALDDGERRTRAALRSLPDGVVTHEDVMEDEVGVPSIVLRVRLEKRGDAIRLDYEGTAPQRPMPLNSVYGVTLSGAYYALRAVTDPRIPMNDGSFRPIEVVVPEGTLLNPRRPAPVSAGNVETSMRNADLVLGALALLAPGRVPAVWSLPSRSMTKLGIVSLPCSLSATQPFKCRMKIFTRTWSGTNKLKSGASVAKWPTSSGLVAVFAAISGIGHGHLFTPPPQSAGIASPGAIALCSQLRPPSIGPSCGSVAAGSSQRATRA